MLIEARLGDNLPLYAHFCNIDYLRNSVFTCYVIPQERRLAYKRWTV